VITNSTEDRLLFNLQDMSRLAEVDHQMDIQGNSCSSMRCNMAMKQRFQIKQSLFSTVSFSAVYALEL
jgi:hypothetical protein